MVLIYHAILEVHFGNDLLNLEVFRSRVPPIIFFFRFGVVEAL